MHPSHCVMSAARRRSFAGRLFATVLAGLPATLHAASFLTSNTTQNGGTLTINPTGELVISGASTPQLTLTNAATTAGVEGVALGVLPGNGALRLEGGSTITNTGDGSAIAIWNGNPIRTGTVHLGLNIGASGSAVVTGAGSTWTNGS